MGCNGRTFQEVPPDWNCHVRVGCNGLQWEDFSGITPWLKLPCKSGLQWVAMGGLFRNYPLTEIAMSEWAAVACIGRTFQELPHPWLKVPCKSGLQWAAMGRLFRNYPLTEIAMKEWAAMGCNGRTFQELTPDWNGHVRVGCNGLQWEDFSEITSWMKLPCRSGLQWAAMGGLFMNYPLTEIAM